MSTVYDLPPETPLDFEATNGWEGRTWISTGEIPPAWEVLFAERHGY